MHRACRLLGQGSWGRGKDASGPFSFPEPPIPFNPQNLSTGPHDQPGMAAAMMKFLLAEVPVLLYVPAQKLLLAGTTKRTFYLKLSGFGRLR